LPIGWKDVIDDLAITEEVKGRIIQVPHVNLTRLSQIKVAATKLCYPSQRKRKKKEMRI